nr:DUF6009 family protein [Streptomyces sp. CoH27]
MPSSPSPPAAAGTRGPPERPYQLPHPAHDRPTGARQDPRRRVFFLLPHDRDAQPEGLYQEGAPEEAVDPRTIEVRKVGEKTPRSQQGPAAGAVTGAQAAC